MKADPARYIAARPGPDLSKEEAARRCIAAFARRAFRRPVDSDEVDRLMRLFRRAEARGDGFEAAVRLALRAVLVSPSFLYLLERDRTDVEGPYRVSDHELACRLSYFLWSSMPDARAVGPGRRRAAPRARGARNRRCGGCSPTRSRGRWPRTSPASGSASAAWPIWPSPTRGSSPSTRPSCATRWSRRPSPSSTPSSARIGPSSSCSTPTIRTSTSPWRSTTASRG